MNRSCSHTQTTTFNAFWSVYAVVFIGAILGAVQCYFQYTGIALDRQPLCLVMEENFNDPAQVFGEPGGTGGTFMREVNMDGFGFALIFPSIPRSRPLDDLPRPLPSSFVEPLRPEAQEKEHKIKRGSPNCYSNVYSSSDVYTTTTCDTLTVCSTVVYTIKIPT
jgi:hypothetical protein